VSNGPIKVSARDGRVINNKKNTISRRRKL